MALYDTLGVGYTRVRGEDPRIAAAIHAALGDARTVVNVGAGTGSYEPRDREVVAVEPSEVMIAQRAPGSAPVVRATAEALPFEDDSFDAAMAVLSDHHWPDRAGGLEEMRRVARRRAVVFQFDLRALLDFWLVREYLVSFRPDGSTADGLERHLGVTRVETVPIPHDCRDGFLSAYWRRPHAYLDPAVRAGISVFRLSDPADVEQAMERLRADLESGEWARRHAGLFEHDELDLGYRLWIADYGNDIEGSDPLAERANVSLHAKPRKEVRVKEFRCGVLVPGCYATFEGESDDEILRQVFVHAREEHGMDQVPPEVVDEIRAEISEREPR